MSNKQAAELLRPGPGPREALDTSRKCLVIFGVASAVVLGVVGAKSLSHDPVNTFMWVRSVILLALAPVFYQLALRAASGSRNAFGRLRLLSTVLPLAIVVVDLIPGVCPVWYAAVQGASAIPLIAVAVITRREPLRSAFAPQGAADVTFQTVDVKGQRRLRDAEMSRRPPGVSGEMTDPPPSRHAA
jgi:hypothetical protein